MLHALQLSWASRKLPQRVTWVCWVPLSDPMNVDDLEGKVSIDPTSYSGPKSVTLPEPPLWWQLIKFWDPKRECKRVIRDNVTELIEPGRREWVCRTRSQILCPYVCCWTEDLNWAFRKKNVTLEKHQDLLSCSPFLWNWCCVVTWVSKMSKKAKDWGSQSIETDFWKRLLFSR